jgi:serine acetyltransferase
MIKNLVKDLDILKYNYGNSYFKSIISSRGFHALLFYRISHKFDALKIPLVSLVLTRMYTNYLCY